LGERRVKGCTMRPVLEVLYPSSIIELEMDIVKGERPLSRKSLGKTGGQGRHAI
jgi:hypothetical protein